MEVSHSLLGHKNTLPGDFIKARAAWFKDGYGDTQAPGEGLSSAAKLAWRDADPFADEKEWMEWAQAISQPLAEWKDAKKK
jgi:hypothetical protein